MDQRALPIAQALPRVVLNILYDKFFKSRCKAISQELAKRVVPQDINLTGQARSAEDTVVVEEDWLAT